MASRLPTKHHASGQAGAPVGCSPVPMSLPPREAAFAPCPGRALTRRGFFFRGREDYFNPARRAPSARMTAEVYRLLVRNLRFPMAGSTSSCASQSSASPARSPCTKAPQLHFTLMRSNATGYARR